LSGEAFSSEFGEDFVTEVTVKGLSSGVGADLVNEFPSYLVAVTYAIVSGRSLGEAEGVFELWVSLRFLHIFV
jgi:hypothetical protein